MTWDQNEIFHRLKIFDSELCSKVLKEALLSLLLFLLLAWNKVKKKLQMKQNLFHNEQKTFHWEQKIFANFFFQIEQKKLQKEQIMLAIKAL